MRPPRKAGPLTLVCIWATFLVLTLSVYLTPRDGQTVAIIAFPYAGTSSAEIVARADGLIEDSAWSGQIILARASSPQFTQRLYAHGALVVFNPRILFGCKGSLS